MKIITNGNSDFFLSLKPNVSVSFVSPVSLPFIRLLTFHYRGPQTLILCTTDLKFGSHILYSGMRHGINAPIQSPNAAVFFCPIDETPSLSSDFHLHLYFLTKYLVGFILISKGFLYITIKMGSGMLLNCAQNNLATVRAAALLFQYEIFFASCKQRQCPNEYKRYSNRILCAVDVTAFYSLFIVLTSFLPIKKNYQDIPFPLGGERDKKMSRNVLSRRIFKVFAFSLIFHKKTPRRTSVPHLLFKVAPEYVFRYIRCDKSIFLHSHIDLSTYSFKVFVSPYGITIELKSLIAIDFHSFFDHIGRCVCCESLSVISFFSEDLPPFTFCGIRFFYLVCRAPVHQVFYLYSKFYSNRCGSFPRSILGSLSFPTASVVFILPFLNKFKFAGLFLERFRLISQYNSNALKCCCGTYSFNSFTPFLKCDRRTAAFFFFYVLWIYVYIFHSIQTKPLQSVKSIQIRLSKQIANPMERWKGFIFLKRVRSRGGKRNFLFQLSLALFSLSYVLKSGDDSLQHPNFVHLKTWVQVTYMVPIHILLLMIIFSVVIHIAGWKSTSRLYDRGLIRTKELTWN